MAQSDPEYIIGREQSDPHAGTQPTPEAAPGGFAPVDQPVGATQPAPPWPSAYPQPGPPAWIGYPYPAQQPAATAPPRRSSKRVWAVISVGLAAACVVFGAGYVAGSNSAKPAAAPAPAGAAEATPSASADGSEGRTLDTSLTSVLLPLPSGAIAHPPKQAGADGTLSLDDYLALLYPTPVSSATERNLLVGRGFEAAATRWFFTATGEQVNLYLVQFSAPSAAQSYADALSGAHRLQRSADPSFPVAGLTGGAGFEEAALDTLGNTRTFVYGNVGNVTVLLHFYVPAKLDRAAALYYVDSQVARLASAETATS